VVITFGGALLKSGVRQVVKRLQSTLRLCVRENRSGKRRDAKARRGNLNW
jgi:hypothetical protein